MDSRERYRRFCREEPGVPIFSQDWWLDAVCGEDGWDASLVEENGHVVGALPFHRTRHLGFRVIHMPGLTPSFRLWIRQSDSTRLDKRLCREKEIVTRLVRQLPHFDYFRLRFDHTLANWLPFYWQGFSQTTLYTYVIEDLSDPERVFQSFSHAKRKNIKKAERSLTLGPELSARAFYEHHAMTLGKRRDRVGYDSALFERIHHATHARGSGKIFTAIDSAGRTHAAIFVVWDPAQAYYLISSIDPDFKDSGAATYLIFHAIKHLSGRTRQFDFEGSMIEGVENSFNQFGTVQRQYFRISKIPSKALLLRQLLLDCMKRAA